MVQNLRVSRDGERAVADVFRRAQLFLCRRFTAIGLPKRGNFGNFVLVEFFATRDVFLWHDRLSGRVLSLRVGHVAVLPAHPPIAIAWANSNWLADFRPGYFAASHSVGDHFFASHRWRDRCPAAADQQTDPWLAACRGSGRADQQFLLADSRL